MTQCTRTTAVIAAATEPSVMPNTPEQKGNRLWSTYSITSNDKTPLHPTTGWIFKKLYNNGDNQISVGSEDHPIISSVYACAIPNHRVCRKYVWFKAACSGSMGWERYSLELVKLNNSWLHPAPFENVNFIWPTLFCSLRVLTQATFYYKITSYNSKW